MRRLAVLTISTFAGVVFGAVIALVNAWSSAYGGTGLRNEGLRRTMEVASLILGSPWAWAGFAFAVGWLLARRRPLLGATAALLALPAANLAYYAVKAPLADNTDLLIFRTVAAVLIAPALGAAGTQTGRPGLIGLLAGSAIPVGAAAHLIVFPVGYVAPARVTVTTIAELLVWTFAIGGVVVAFAGYLRRRKPDPRDVTEAAA